MALTTDRATVVTFDERTGFEIAPELCTGCGLCQLSCTHVKKRVFSLEGAYIRIDRVGNLESFVPTFTEDCDSCGVCLNYCGYEAIRKPGATRSWYARLRKQREAAAGPAAQTGATA